VFLLLHPLLYRTRLMRYIGSITVGLSNGGRGSGGYIKWLNFPLAPQGLRLNHLLSTTHFTYIHHHGFFRRRPRTRSGLQSSELVLYDVCCVVLIATGSSTTRAPSTSLTSAMSSLPVLLPMRFDPTVLSFFCDI
jgi:hypothetical protein